MGFAVSYATPAQFLRFYDARNVGDLVSDTGTRVAAGDLPNDSVLAACLEVASGEIDSALLNGKRYSSADLAALTGNSAALLQFICSRIAYRVLWDRRPYSDDPRKITAFEQAHEQLDKLRRGQAIFEIDANLNASTPKIDGPTAQTVRALNGVSTRARGHLYPAERLPRNR